MSLSDSTPHTPQPLKTNYEAFNVPSTQNEAYPSGPVVLPSTTHTPTITGIISLGKRSGAAKYYSGDIEVLLDLVEEMEPIGETIGAW